MSYGEDACDCDREARQMGEEPRPIRRRVFIGRVAKKAAYVAPAVLALKAATTAHAGISACGQTGSPCLTDADCCVGFFCLNMAGMPCEPSDTGTCE